MQASYPQVKKKKSLREIRTDRISRNENEQEWDKFVLQERAFKIVNCATQGIMPVYLQYNYMCILNTALSEHYNPDISIKQV